MNKIQVLQQLRRDVEHAERNRRSAQSQLDRLTRIVAAWQSERDKLNAALKQAEAGQ